MRIFTANSGGAPKLEVPVVKALDNALAGRESILMYAGVQRLVKLGNGLRKAGKKANGAEIIPRRRNSRQVQS